MNSNAVDEQADAAQAYPLWAPTDWTPRQRLAALLGLCLLILAYALLVSASTTWKAGSLADSTLFPIGVTLLCLGTTLVSYAYWYAYKHSYTTGGEHAVFGWLVYGFLLAEGVVALVTLALQLVGATLLVTAGWRAWRDIGGFSAALPGFVSLLASWYLLLSAQTASWRPIRDPMAPGSLLGAPVRGLRLTCRWLALTFAQYSWLLIAAEFYLLVTNQIAEHSALALGMQGAVGVFFLIATVAELTHHE